MSANLLQRGITVRGTLTLKPYANVTRGPVLCHQSIKKAYDPHQGHLSTKTFQLFQSVYPTSWYTIQDLSMLYVLRIFRRYLEYHDRLSSHDISFTLPTFYQYAHRAITNDIQMQRYFSDEIRMWYPHLVVN